MQPERQARLRQRGGRSQEWRSHPRSLLDVYLRGATATSWMLPNGSDVLYVRTDTEMEQFYPIRCAQAAACGA